MSGSRVKRDVRIDVAAGPLGILLEADYNGMCAVIKSFQLTPSGRESPLKKRIRKGMVLVAINDTVVTKKKHDEVKRLLQSTMNRRRTLLFRDGSVHYANKDAKGSSSKSDSSHVDIEVRSARLNRETSKTFAEFELLVSLRVRSKLGHAINQWSLWKRYSETGDLDKRMRAQYGWQMEKIKFPSKKTFGNLDPVFLESRREGFDFYFHEILAISDIADFRKHFSSQDLKQFIQYESNKEIKSNETSSSGGSSSSSSRGGDGERKTSSKSSRSRTSRSSRPRSSRRRSRASRETGTSSSNSTNKNNGEETLALMPPEASEPVEASSSGAGSAMGPEYDPFVRMQKAGVPEGAIRQKMMSGGVDPTPMFGGGGGGGGGGGHPRGPPPSALPIKARAPPPLAAPATKQTVAAPAARRNAPPAARGGLLAAIQKGKMLKKTETKTPPPPGTAKPAAPANPMSKSSICFIIFWFMVLNYLKNYCVFCPYTDNFFLFFIYKIYSSFFLALPLPLSLFFCSFKWRPFSQDANGRNDILRVHI